MSHSIRLRFVDWLKSIFNDAVELCSHQLSKPQVHSQARANMRLRGVGVVNDRLGKGQVDNAAPVTPFNEHAGYHGRNTIIDQNPVYIGYAQGLAARNNDFISHQHNPPITNIIIGNFNQRRVGVQSSKQAASV